MMRKGDGKGRLEGKERMLMEAYTLFGALGSGIGHLARRLSGHDGIVCEKYY